MTQRFPIHIHRRDENGATTFLATTALVKLADAPDRLQLQLRDFAETYSRALVDARAALADAGRERARTGASARRFTVSRQRSIGQGSISRGRPRRSRATWD